MSRPKQPDLSPAALARAIVMLRAQGKDEEADELAAYLPPAHDPLPHLDGNGLPVHHTGPVPGDTDPKTPPPATGMPMPPVPGGLSPHGPPHPENPHSAGSAPPRVMKAFDPTSPLDAIAYAKLLTDDVVNAIAEKWFWPDGSSKTRARIQHMIRQVAEDHGLSVRDAASALEKAMLLNGGEHVVGGPKAYWQVVSQLDSAPTSSPNVTSEPERRFGCVMLPLPPGAADRVLALGRMIPDHDLADAGREDQPHVTAVYGIHSDDPLPVYRVLENFRPVKLKLGNCSVFPGEAYDVLKIDVESDALKRLNSSLRSLPHTSTYKNFVPHCTIAYVRPGLGAVYAARFGDLDTTCVADVAVFSDSQKQRSMVPLGRMVRVEKSAMSYLNSGTGGALVAPAGMAGKPVKLRRKKRKLLARMCKDALAELSGFEKAFDPSEPRDTKGEWTGGDQDAAGSGIATQSDFKSAVSFGNFIGAAMSSVADVSSEKLSARVKAAKDVASKLTPAALSRLSESVRSVKSYKDTDGIKEAFNKIPGVSPATDDEDVGGFYDPVNGTLHIDGGFGSIYKDSLGESNLSAKGIYAHEVTHGIDAQLNSRGKRVYALSAMPAFRDAFNEEIADGQLSDFATTHPSEGFAEFGRLLYGSDVPIETVAKRFPKTLAYFRSEGLV